MDMLNLFTENIDKVLTVIGAASTIATITPTKKDDTILGYLAKLVHFLALNVGKAKV